MNLTELANLHKSDKGQVKQAHHYTRLYEMLLFPYRDRQLSLLEMGLQIGGPENNKPADRKTTKLPSINMWLDYLPKAQVFGLDISDFSWFEHDRFTFVQCDMEDRTSIAAAKDRVGQSLDIILDDASHASHHQQIGLLEFWPLLKPGGLYIIEDLHWQPPAYEREGYTKTRDLLRGFMNTGTFTHSDPHIGAAFSSLADDIGFCQVFRHNFASRGPDKVAVLHKATKL